MSAVLFGLEQNFVLWAALLGLIHFQWLNPLAGLVLVAVAGWRWYEGSFASKGLIVAWGMGALFFYALRSLEFFYFALGISLPFFLLVHTFFPQNFVIARRSLSPAPALFSLILLYPGAFYALHEPGLPIPAMFTASGFIYIPFLPLQAALLKNQDLMLWALKFLNW